jgi:hypothetical protein
MPLDLIADSLQSPAAPFLSDYLQTVNFKVLDLNSNFDISSLSTEKTFLIDLSLAEETENKAIIKQLDRLKHLKLLVCVHFDCLNAFLLNFLIYQATDYYKLSCLPSGFTDDCDGLITKNEKQKYLYKRQDGKLRKWEIQ